ncbi:MAG: DUF2225 domain-containing protein [Clostridiales bacterium]|nr:DUF2225 domain-containing protein [Clostridiales bacterium]
MNLFAGLEKFGLKAEGTTSLFEEEKKVTTTADGTQKEEIPDEDSFLLDKAIRCAVCDKVFKTKIIKNGRVKRMEPDLDLRPRFEYIDTLKYNVVSCPYCGYTALNRYFEHLSTGQRKLIKEQVSANFRADASADPIVLDYDMAIERYKLALFNAIVKKARTSEKAYICLNIAWLYRGQAETITGTEEEAVKKKAECKEQEEAFYQQAFEGFMKAVSSEDFPMCGMDSCTVDYLLATMAYHYKKYDVASKCIARIQATASASKKMKDRAYDLKEKIVAEIKSNKA